MSTSIYYFSGTGNSLYVAKTIHEGISDSELISVSKVINEKINITCDRMIIVFPVYLWG